MFCLGWRPGALLLLKPPLGGLVGLLCRRDGVVKGGLEGGCSNSTTSMMGSPSGPGTLSYCEALEARLEPGVKPRECGRRPPEP